MGERYVTVTEGKREYGPSFFGWHLPAMPNDLATYDACKIVTSPQMLMSVMYRESENTL